MAESLTNVLIIHTASFFILTGIAKLISFKEFLHYTAEFKILPRRLSLAAGSLIPFLEILGGSLLLYSIWWNLGAAILLLLLSVFSYSILKTIKAERKIKCGCYGKWLEADADIFSFGKAVYFFILLLFISSSVPKTGISVSFPAAAAGSFITVLVIAAQKIWQVYKQNKQQLQNKR